MARQRNVPDVLKNLLSADPAQRALLIAGIAFIAIIAGGTTLALWRHRTAALDQGEGQLSNLVLILEDQARHAVREVDLALLETAGDYRDATTGRLADAQLQERLTNRMAQLPQLRALAVIGAGGELAAGSPAFPAPAVNYADREYFQALRDGTAGGLHVGEPARDRTTREWAYTFSRRIDGPDGGFRGVAVAVISMPYSQDFYRSLDLGPAGRTLLFRRDGVLLSSYPPEPEAAGRSFARHELFSQELARSAGGVRRGPGLLDAEPRFIAYQVLRDYPLVVAVSSTQRYVLKDWYRAAWQLGVVSAVVASFVVLVLFLLDRQHRFSAAHAREVRDAERRWLAAMEAAGHGVWDWDVSSDKVYRSPHYHKILGYSGDEIPGGREGWFQLLHPDDRKLSHQASRACLDGEVDTFSAELRLRCKDGGWKWVLNRGMVAGRDGQGRALRMLGTITDMSEHFQAQQRLHESEMQLNGIIASAMDAIITVDERQNIVLFNAAAEKIFRCPAAEAIGGPLGRFIPERFREAHREHIERFGATGDTTRAMGARMALSGLRADGGEFPIDASISQIMIEGRKLYTVILRDISERRRAEDALERSHRELRELSGAMNEVREAERTRIARELHDELAQWLTAIKMDVSWLSSRLPREQRPLLDRAEKLKAMVDTTVSAVRRIAADLRPVMLDDLGLVPATESLLHEFSQRTGVLVSLDLDSDKLDFGDPLATSVYRMVQEAITNVARHAEATEVRITMRHRDENLVVQVRDNGKGFDPEVAARKKSFGVLGIRERAHTLGGAARIVRLESGGTLVEIMIPVARYRRGTRHDTGVAG